MDSPYRYCRHVLRMVQELHVRGYQRLRIAPGLSPSGLHWRCAITPASNVDPRNGAHLINERTAAEYHSGSDNLYFGWADEKHASPSRLSTRFIEAFPELAEAGRGSDWPYAGWYAEMLGLTWPDAVPIAYADWAMPPNEWGIVGGHEGSIPLPPPIPVELRRTRPKAIVSGVDGCRSGWLCVTENPESDTLSARIFGTFRELLEAEHTSTVIAIDIPIGLTDRGPRACDTAARRRLGARRGSSVFPAPIRSVLEATDYADACRLRRLHEGSAMSQQAFGILPKVKEVDALLSADPSLQTRVREVHPEISFAEWAGRPMQNAKRTSAGRLEREALIEETWLGERKRLATSLGRGGWQADDLNDALAALWTARRISAGREQVMPASPEVDADGLRMEIVL
jgi:predicted RNase H-like nuclease